MDPNPRLCECDMGQIHMSGPEGVCQNPPESAESDQTKSSGPVQQSPADSGGFRQSPTDSGRVQQILADSGRFHQTQADSTTHAYLIINKKDYLII